MDFGSLLHAAKLNEDSVKKEVRTHVANFGRWYFVVNIPNTHYVVRTDV